MVSRVREGVGLRAVAREFRVALSQVQRWVARAGDLPLKEVDWSDRPSGCRVSPQRTRARLEERALRVRKSLQTTSDLGEYGAAAIPRERRRVSAGGCVRAVKQYGRVFACVDSIERQHRGSG